ncbi:hypothetical protein, partial [Chryseobacterium sp. CH1]|uniref:hypothetical protein n=1 Tax=Chryseobacterium sp. CH1 TaxID=713551 RepID=UPI001E511803
SVAVRLIVEREKEIREFTPKASFKLDGIFSNKTEQEIAAKLKKTLKKKKKQKNSWNRSVAVRLIVEREKEIREFTPKASFKLDGIFSNKT